MELTLGMVVKKPCETLKDPWAEDQSTSTHDQGIDLCCVIVALVNLRTHALEGWSIEMILVPVIPNENS